MKHDAGCGDPIAQITDLWIAVYGEPPPVQAAAPIMIEALVSGLAEPPIGSTAPPEEGEGRG